LTNDSAVESKVPSCENQTVSCDHRPFSSKRAISRRV
jgi:hypothetical protein